ncbi:hypothetical protein [Pectobacterium polaris]|uniref:hypothetical protein n=1 Tax=Pectobacterium polaris TaxID=2042057 RepID=UPI002404A5CA|nr:hypothetical protein [Pectobacterium polaris]MDG0801449.1 hypothetical protein [Pectobacterium polaris]
MYTIVAVLNENNETIGYWIIGPDGRVLATNPSIFAYYDDALQYLIKILDDELNKFENAKIIRQKKEITNSTPTPDIHNKNKPHI